MSLKKGVLIGFFLAAALILVFYFLQGRAQSANTSPEPETTQSETNNATTPSDKESSDVVDRPNGFSQPSPDANQAPELATETPSARQEIKAPAVTKPDTKKPATVAQAVLTNYSSRVSETDEGWKDSIAGWVTPGLAKELPTIPNGSITGKAPVEVTAVEVGEQIKEWGADTPLRWSHQMDVKMKTQDQGTYLIRYRVQAQLTDQGWLVNTVKPDTWQRVEI